MYTGLPALLLGHSEFVRELVKSEGVAISVFLNRVMLCHHLGGDLSPAGLGQWAALKQLRPVRVAAQRSRPRAGVPALLQVLSLHWVRAAFKVAWLP